MNFEGLLIGLFAFLIIAIFHPVVIKCEYCFSSQIWPAFLLGGVVFLLIAINLSSVLCSAVLCILSFACFWSIGELKEQEERVKKGWFPENPNRQITCKTFKFRKRFKRKSK